jgi:sulfur carrier protein ThiS
MASHPVTEPWVLVADVLAEAASVDPSRSFDTQARGLAKTMRGVRHDWAGRPCVTWSTAAELLASLRAEQARVAARIEQQAIEKDQAFRDALPAGVAAERVPEGFTAAELLMLSDPERRKSERESVLEHALRHPAGALVYHPLQPEPADR